MSTFADVIAIATLRESSVDLFLNGGLVAEYERLERLLDDASAVADSLGELSPRAAVAEQMEDLRQQMIASQVAFRLRALPTLGWSNYAATQPAVPVDDADDTTVAAFREAAHLWACDLIARCCFDPAMTVDEANQLSDVLSDGQWRQLVDGCWTVNQGTQSIPFSVAAYAHLPPTGQKRKRRSPSVSRVQSSSAVPSPK